VPDEAAVTFLTAWEGLIGMASGHADICGSSVVRPAGDYKI
jgi:molybdate-binding protein